MINLARAAHPVAGFGGTAAGTLVPFTAGISLLRHHHQPIETLRARLEKEAAGAGFDTPEEYAASPVRIEKTEDGAYVVHGEQRALRRLPGEEEPDPKRAFARQRR